MDSFLEETLSPSGVKPTEPLISRHLRVISGVSIWTMLILISAHIVIGPPHLPPWTSTMRIAALTFRFDACFL